MTFLRSLGIHVFERLIELVEQGQAFLGGPVGGEGAKTGFRVEFGEAVGGQFLDQLVHADTAMMGKLAKPGMLFVGQSDGEGAHGIRK